MKRQSVRLALAGALLGVGAPLGSLAWRAIANAPGPLIATLTEEWRVAGYYYIYMTVGSVVAFSLFGYVIGRGSEKLSNLSITDGLTGLYNHRYLHEQLAHEIRRSARYHAPVTCLMLDIDDFKHVNDAHGHPFGDTVLSTTARLIHESVRNIDFVGRYGGEEFLVIMPETGGEAALPIAKRIVQTIQDYPFLSPEGSVRITVSIGLATYPSAEQGVKSKNGLLSAADQALYRAKRAGKNQTVVWRS